MARFFLSRDAMDLASGVIPITGDDAHHIAFSLRMAVGDSLTVCDMQKTEYACTITDIKPELVLLRIDAVKENRTELPVEVCLYQSLPKGDKMDYIVQKAVELGVSSVIPVAGARCIVKLDEKMRRKKLRAGRRSQKKPQSNADAVWFRRSVCRLHLPKPLKTERIQICRCSVMKVTERFR